MYELIPRSGFGSRGRLRRDFDGVLNRLFDEAKFPVEGVKGFVPSVDFKETEEAFELTAEVPGLKPEEIDITLTGDLLTLKGEKKEETEKTEGDYHLVERSFGSFQRSFRLPGEIDRDNLKASHKNGVLRVVLPKTVKSGPTRIEVKPS